jgi:hypothetical protein
MTLIDHHDYFEHCRTALNDIPQRLSVSWMWLSQSWSHEQEAQEIIVVLICIYKLKCGSLFAHLGRISPVILKLGIRWRPVFSFTHRHFITYGKTLCYTLNGRQGGPQNQSGCFWRWEKPSVIVVNRTVSHLSNSYPIFVQL